MALEVPSSSMILFSWMKKRKSPYKRHWNLLKYQTVSGLELVHGAPVSPRTCVGCNQGVWGNPDLLSIRGHTSVQKTKRILDQRQKTCLHVKKGEKGKVLVFSIVWPQHKMGPAPTCHPGRWPLSPWTMYRRLNSRYLMEQLGWWFQLR